MSNLPTKDQCCETSRVLKLMDHPQRLLILCALTEGPKSVGELEVLSDAGQSSVSQFLSRMKAEKLVKSERKANYVYYEIADPRISELIQCMRKIFC
ncbi:MAG: transcriptional regulator [Bdellovibrionaceae bacterium]|nr:transcriptional regulator [Pseudobdellovibrionaceae bacterium]|tara:strand:+ start:88 stop:378 length:291 start_codon:yes stop_codon:yes gene_type:complete